MEWREIPNFSYEISAAGLVRRTVTVRGKPPKVLRPWPNAAGYLVVYLVRSGKRHRRFIHRLVCAAFHENPDDKNFVDHIDRNPRNNNASNLRWASPKDNGGNSRSRNSIKGVSRHHSGRWAAYGSAGGRTIYLGLADTKSDAGRLYDRWATRRYGEFAALNFPYDSDADAIGSYYDAIKAIGDDVKSGKRPVPTDGYFGSAKG